MVCLITVAEKPDDGFHLDLEDYLMGVLTLASELVSFVISMVQEVHDVLNVLANT